MQKDDVIYRQAALDAIKELESGEDFNFNNGLICAMNNVAELPSAQSKIKCIANITMTDEQVQEVFERAKAQMKLMMFPSAQPETCEGCKHLGKWENEVEYGYPSPCTCCKRRAVDHYER